MRLFSTNDEPTMLRTRYRAECQTCNFKSPWEDTEAKAAEDAKRHWQRPGKANDVIKLVADIRASRDLSR